MAPVLERAAHGTDRTESVLPRQSLTPGIVLLTLLASLFGMFAGGRGRATARGTARLAAQVPSFADIVESLNPAVVAITVVENGPPRPGDDDPDPEPGPRRGEGTGFIVDSAGYILTNHHVVAAPQRIRVRLSDKREMVALLVGSDPSTDLALIKVEATDLPVVPLGDSDRLRVGDWVCVIGNPFSYEHSVTVGVVSSKGRKIYDASFDAYIQTDAAINPGNSGGPLINAAGEAVGISAAVSTEGQGIGFAVPINVAREILEQLRTQGRVRRGYLGVQLQELDPDFRRLVGFVGVGGAMVVDVLPDSAGEKAGLRPYDVIVGVAGQSVADGDHLIRTIAARPPGDIVDLGVFRKGASLALKATLAERRIEEDEHAALSGEAKGADGDVLGLKVSTLTRKMQSELKIPKDRSGVVIADVVGLSRGLDEVANGDLVVEVNRTPTPDLRRYREALAGLTPGQVAFLLVYRPQPPGTYLTKVEVEEPKVEGRNK